MTSVSSVEIEIHTRESCIVTLHGEHDAASSEEVTLALALARGHTHVIVDLTPCTFLDGTIINALLTSAAHMRVTDGALELVAPHGATAVRRTLGFAGVLTLLPAHASRSEAIAAITAAARVRAHSRTVSLCAVSAEIDHLNSKTEAARATRPGTSRGLTVVRAHVEDSVVDPDEARRRRGA